VLRGHKKVAPGVPLGQFDTPTQGLRVLDRQFDVLVGVSGPAHPPNPTPSVDTCQAKIAGDLVCPYNRTLPVKIVREGKSIHRRESVSRLFNY